jgi:negative regulator of sigma E activity
MNDAIRMQISAFVDGELPENEAEMLLRRMSQDAELRQQVADYLATGRLIRGERSVAGMDRLRDRIAAEINERPLQEDTSVAEQHTPRYVRPLAGVAIAATVTLAAIFGLQQTMLSSDQPDATAIKNVADASAADQIYTVPTDDMLVDYRMSHGVTSLDIGASDVSARLVSLQSRGVLEDMDPGTDPGTDNGAAEEPSDEVTGESSSTTNEQAL